ncbi:Cell division protein ZapA [Candidatus Blochmanniella floridana]|uniref:Cell division protein ZapA n=1 Tax=Blochmanniella floridana TaxID=203907 RepID=Q7VRF9_BLOFL|nr:Cell division protein ZapA [Candidatus Blochmannia floridanus]
MSEQPIDIQIFGKTLRINCPPHQKKDLNKAVEDLTQRLQNLKIRTKVTNSEQLIFITALNICYELTQEKLKTIEYATNIRQHLTTIQKTINQALEEHDKITECSHTILEYSKDI